MDDMTREPNEENVLICEMRDEVLEAAAHPLNKNADTFTQWMCTALYFCPGP